MHLTLAECKARAREKLELAEREPRHRRKHLAAAQAWLKLAGTFDSRSASPETFGKRMPKEDG